MCGIIFTVLSAPQPQSELLPESLNLSRLFPFMYISAYPFDDKDAVTLPISFFEAILPKSRCVVVNLEVKFFWLAVISVPT